MTIGHIVVKHFSDRPEESVVGNSSSSNSTSSFATQVPQQSTGCWYSSSPSHMTIGHTAIAHLSESTERSEDGNTDRRTNSLLTLPEDGNTDGRTNSLLTLSEDGNTDPLSFLPPRFLPPRRFDLPLRLGFIAVWAMKIMQRSWAICSINPVPLIVPKF